MGGPVGMHPDSVLPCMAQKLQALQQSTVGDRAAMEQRYRKRLSEMDARLKQVHLCLHA